MRFGPLYHTATLLTTLGLGITSLGCSKVMNTWSTLPPVTLTVCKKNPTAKLWNDIGSGTLTDPHVICTASQFASIGKDSSSWAKHFALGTTIDLQKYDDSTSEWSLVSIGIWDYVTPANNVPFTGTFDGQGFTLKNIKMVAVANQGVGPFGFTTGASIHDLRITGLDLSGGGHIGGLVSTNKSSLLRDIYVEGTITGTFDRLAGLAANNDGSGAGSDASILRATTNVRITGNGASGGLAGIATLNDARSGGRADITDSHALGSLTITTFGDTVGGFIAYNIADGGGSAKFLGCSATGDITIADRGGFSGLFIGTNTADGIGTNTSVTNSFTTGTFTSSGGAGGNLIGGLEGVNNCNNGANCSITRSYVRGAINIPSGSSGRFGVGLLVGSNNPSSGANASIVDSYALGSINISSSGSTNVGGLVGNFGNDAVSPVSVDRSYSSVSVTTFAPNPGAKYGAIFGGIGNVGPGSLIVSDTFWNVDLYATGSGTAVAGITAKTASELTHRVQFTNWDFVSVWKISEGVSSPTL